MMIKFITLDRHLKKLEGLSVSCVFFLLFAFYNVSEVQAQSSRNVQGIVKTENNEPVEGASIRVKSVNFTTTSNSEGKFTINLPQGRNTLLISMVGFNQLEYVIENPNSIEIFLKESSIDIEETVVVGYGKQRKESVVGAITQTTGEVLERTGGVTNLGMALIPHL